MSMTTRTIKVSWRTTRVTVTTYKSRTYTPQFAEALKEWERLVRAEGIPFTITQGGFNAGVVASGATHHGDSVDISVRNLSKSQVTRVITIGRMLGMAAWFRTTKYAKWGTRAQGFSSYHIHAVPNGWGVPSPSARSQANSYRSGRDGLARNLADLGPGHVTNYRTRTWAGYLAAVKKPTANPAPLPTQPTTTTPKPTTTGGLGMSSTEFNTVVAMLNEIKAQNKAIHTDVAGGPQIRQRRADDTKATWQFPIHRSAGPVMVINEIAQQTNILQSLMTLVSGISKSSGVDEKKIVEGVVEGISPILRQAIIAAQGEVELDHAEAFADAVFERFRESLNNG